MVLLGHIFRDNQSSRGLDLERSIAEFDILRKALEDSGLSHVGDIGGCVLLDNEFLILAIAIECLLSKIGILFVSEKSQVSKIIAAESGVIILGLSILDIPLESVSALLELFQPRRRSNWKL